MSSSLSGDTRGTEGTSRSYNLFPSLTVSRSTIFSALGGGTRTGKYNDGIPEGSRFHLNPTGAGDERVKYLNSTEGKAMVEKVRQLTKIAEELGGSMTNLALAWTLKHPNMSTCIVSLSSHIFRI